MQAKITNKPIHLARRHIAILLAAVLGCTLFLAAHDAYASVQKADLVMGETVEARGLAVSECPNVEGMFVYLTDNEGTEYFERNADAQVPIASITKVLTAVTALECVPLDFQVYVSDTAATIGESSAALIEGDTLTLDEALKALLIPSGNDSAQAIAESVGAKLLADEGLDSTDPEACEQRFVDEMNRVSQNIGMVNSHWTNPHGLDDGEFASDQHSTARDVGTLARVAMAKDEIRSITSQDFATCLVMRDGVGVELPLESTDELLGAYEGACGIKTGYTDAAGACFAGACSRDGRDLYSVVLYSTDEYQRFTDTTELWDWVFAHTIDYQLCNSDRTTTDSSGKEVPLVAEVADKAWVERSVEATFADPQATVPLLDIDGNVSQSVEYADIKGEVRAGDVVGSVTFMQRNREVAKLDLVAVNNMPAPNFFEGIGVWWTKLIGNLRGDDCIPDNVLYNQPPLLNQKGQSSGA